MTWFLLAAVSLTLAIRLVRRRHRRGAVSPLDGVSTLHAHMSKRHTRETKAALDAATSALR